MKPPFWATLITMLGVLILIGLGTWQLQRLSWKNDILLRLENAYNAPAENLNFSAIDNENSFAYGSVTGRFLFDNAILLGHKVKDGQAGKDLIVPLATNQETILANLGWIANGQDLKTHPLSAFNNQNVTLTGLARRPSWNAFTPDNDPRRDIWYKADTAQIAANKGLQNLSPVILYAMASNPPLSEKLAEKLPNNERWQPDNNHLQYALFWFTLAIALCVIYVLRFLRVKKD
ncbi:MAG: SURF1 family protein [Bdellovibrionales bacterium]